jgi:hypothetical protein
MNSPSCATLQTYRFDRGARMSAAEFVHARRAITRSSRVNAYKEEP